MGSADAVVEAELLEVAVEAARAAAAELLARWRRPLEVGTKSTPTDPVSEADVAAERAIRDVLARRASGAMRSSARREGRDRTSGPGQRAACAGSSTRSTAPSTTCTGCRRSPSASPVEDADGALAGVVLDPVGDELFTATRSGAPLCNGEPITASSCDTLGRALVATGFGYEASVRAAQAEVAARVIPLARDIRRAGAAALDMCGCASGRLDAYYERGVKPWDIAAGTLICERAGLAVRALEADGILPSGIVVAPSALIDELTPSLAAGEPQRA